MGTVRLRTAKKSEDTSYPYLASRGWLSYTKYWVECVGWTIRKSLPVCTKNFFCYFSDYIILMWRYQALSTFPYCKWQEMGGALGTRLARRPLTPCFQSPESWTYTIMCGSFWRKSNPILPFSRFAFWSRYQWASLLQAVRLQIRSKTATIQYKPVASLAGNNSALAHYEQSHGYHQISHALSNIHDLYGCSCNLHIRIQFEPG